MSPSIVMAGAFGYRPPDVRLQWSGLKQDDRAGVDRMVMRACGAMGLWGIWRCGAVPN